VDRESGAASGSGGLLGRMSGHIVTSRRTQIYHDKCVYHQTDYSANGICDKVWPRKDTPENEMTKCRVTDIHQPRRMAKLEKLNPEGESKRANAQPDTGGGAKNGSQTEEHHQ